jgi:hypothetical protein
MEKKMGAIGNTRRDFLKEMGIGVASLAVAGYSSFAQ